MFNGLRDHTAESIKSLEGCRRARIEEAQTLTERSLKLLTPTIREPDAEIWASWNPRHRTDAIDKFLRGNPPDNAIVVRANYSDNPGFRQGSSLITTRSTAGRIIATSGKAITCRCSKALTLPTILQWRTRTAA
jgi:Phage terminase large subunit